MWQQISMFDLLETCESRLTAAIKCGSGFSGGRVRIYCASFLLGVKDLAVFMKDEYGIGGHSMTFPDGVHGFVDYDSKGVELWEIHSRNRERHTWTEAAREVKRLILAGEYLNEKERETAQIMRSKGMPKPGYGWGESA